MTGVRWVKGPGSGEVSDNLLLNKNFSTFSKRKLIKKSKYMGISIYAVRIQTCWREEGF